MPSPEHLKHSNKEIREFANAIQRRTADSQKAGNIRRWRNGTTCPDELKVVVDALLAEYESLGKDGANVHAVAQRQAATTKPQGMPQRYDAARSSQSKATNAAAADPAVLGSPFHNPYTFLPFGDPRSRRRRSTLLSADERERDRTTGVVELRIRTLSPLLTCDPKPIDDRAEHHVHRALTVGDDVIVPASGVRGALRTLMTVLTGGTLGYLDETLWLCQGRDLSLGPAVPQSPAGIPQRPFLGQVIEPGTASRPGTIGLGDTELVPLDELSRELRSVDDRRPRQGRPRTPPSKYNGWLVKLSGRRVNTKGRQREGLFRPDGRTLELPPSLWAAYLGRHRHGDVSELATGDLVWLEPRTPALQRIESAGDIKSLQWARWGRQGVRLLDLIRTLHPQVLPDAFNPDGLVDEVTDLFGHVPHPARGGESSEPGRYPGPAPSFAARVRPENLVFRDGAKRLERVTLAPLQPPHPGCLGFYRDNDDLDAISIDDPLRGYKVYRTTTERGENAPWRFEVQGVYDNPSVLRSPKQKVNKTCDLLAESLEGALRIAVRSLTRREVALLLLACSVDWRIGGGKPLGLGHARVTEVRIRDETGTIICDWRPAGCDALDRKDPAPLPAPWNAEVADLRGRSALYSSTQRPVERLRYPGAVSENQRGGHVWFGRHAAPRKSTAGQSPGLQVLWVGGDLERAAGGDQVRAQPLPAHASVNPAADALHGYDLTAPQHSTRKEGGKTIYTVLVPFDPKTHKKATDGGGGRQGQTRDSRRSDRERR